MGCFMGRPSCPSSRVRVTFAVWMLSARKLEEIAVEHHEVRQLSGLDRAGLLVLVERVGGVDGVERDHRRKIHPLLGIPRGAGLSDPAVGDADLDGVERIERGDRPVAPARHHGPRSHHARDRVLPARPLGSERGLGQHGEILVPVGPERLEVGHDAERAEARDIGGVNDLEMGDGVPRIARAVPRPGLLEGVQRHPDGPVADGVDVNLEALPVERGRQPVEGGLVVVRGAGVSVAVEVGSEHRGRPRLDDAVLIQLHGDRAHVRSCIPSAQGARPGDDAVHVSFADIGSGHDPQA